MIIDKIENISFYSNLTVNLDKAIAYIKNTDFSNMTVGRHEVDKTMFLLVNEYQTQENNLGILEAHKSYIDLQYILEGSENIEYESFNNQIIHTEYNTVDDYILFQNTKNKSQIQFNAGMFAILFPDDLHLPGITNKNISSVRKIVLKVLI